MKNKKAAVLSAVIGVFLIPVLSLAASFEATVKAIHDGDTINVILSDGKTARVRLLGTDSPEVDFNNKSQGEAAFEARDQLISMVPIGSRVTISTAATTQDKHNRFLGKVIYNNVDINSEMLKKGWSAFYMIAPYDKSMAKKYSEAAKEGYHRGNGIFSAKFSNTMMPYQFRMVSSGQKGRNLIGDIETKMLFSPEDVEKIPVYSRIFFPSEQMALKNGYRW